MKMDMIKKYVSQHPKRAIIFALLILVGLPIAVNLLMVINLPITRVGQDNDWIGFFGSYLGALIGGSFAFLVAWIQVQSQNNMLRVDIEDRKRNEKESNRSYIIANGFSAPLDLENVKLPDNSRIIVNNLFEEIAKHNAANHNDKVDHLLYCRLTLVGIPDIVLGSKFSCKISFVDVTNSENVIDSYEENIRIGTITKEEEVFIPLGKIEYYLDKDRKKGNYKIKLNNMQVSYLTVKGEKIEYDRNLDKMKENYFSVHNGIKKPLFEDVPAQTSWWLYPNKKMN